MPVRLIRIERGTEPVVDIKMYFGSIFAGAFLTLGFGLFFLLLGNAVGLSAANTIRGDVTGALKFWSWIYMAAALVFSYFLGGYLCTRTQGVDSPSSGIIHALVSWALASSVILFVGAIASFGIRVLLAGFANNSANWLAICIVGLGGLFSAMGGALGKYSKHHLVGQRVVEDERRVA